MRADLAGRVLDLIPFACESQSLTIAVAQVVEEQLQRYMDAHGIKQSWGTQERILICITPRSSARRNDHAPNPIRAFIDPVDPSSAYR